MNPALKKLGFSEQDRVVIIHTDDIGMCQATLPAYERLLEVGLISAASVMVPCPWFLEAARFCREHKNVDMGVHLTLNSEWDTYRWGPVSTREAASGLVDEQGYFFSDPALTLQRANPQAVATELKTQLERALTAGIDVTHVDSHMGTLLYSAAFLQIYVDLALEYRLPLFFPKPSAENMAHSNGDAALAERWQQLSGELEERGIPLFDAMEALPLDTSTDHLAPAKALIDGLKPGLTYVILHPAIDTPELRASCTPDWPSRVANYEALSNPELGDYIKQAGVQVIGYRQLRDLIRN